MSSDNGEPPRLRHVDLVLRLRERIDEVLDERDAAIEQLKEALEQLKECQNARQYWWNRANRFEKRLELLKKRGASGD